MQTTERWPRGMRRGIAAAYLGISASHFDKQRTSGGIPAPKLLFGVELYDRAELDSLFDGMAATTATNDNDANYWDRACERNH
jgi:hypothetical protein